MSVTLAEPSSSPMYGAAPAKYPAPATYPAAPAPAKYETPATTAQYEAPAPAKYEAAPKYEEKKEEYPMKPEYKTEEKPMEYKKETYPKKMESGGKKYRRSIDDEMEEESNSDPIKLRPFRPFVPFLDSLEVEAVRDAVMEKLESDPGLFDKIIKTVARGARPFLDSDIHGEDSFTALNDPLRKKGIVNIYNENPFRPIPSSLSRKEAKAVRDAVMTQLLMESDPGIFDKIIKTVVSGARALLRSDIRGEDSFTALNDPLRGGLKKGIVNIYNEKPFRSIPSSLSRKEAKAVRDAVMTQLAMESDPGFGKKFIKTFLKKGAGTAGNFVGSQIRGGDPFSVTVADLVQMYGRDPARGKTAGKIAGRFGAGVLGGLLGNEEALSMEELDDMMDDMDPGKRRWW